MDEPTESFVEFYPGQDFGQVIGMLVMLGDPTSRICWDQTGRTLSFRLSYDEGTDWLAEAHHVAGVLGFQLNQITDVWVLGPAVGVDAGQARSIAVQVAQDTMGGIADSLSRQPG